MCLAIPMAIAEMRDDGLAQTDSDSGVVVVDISLVPDAKIGDYVIVHAGYAIEKLDETEARERIALFDQLVQSHEDSENH